MAKEKLKCDVCGKSFKNAAGLAAHKSYVHGQSKKAKRGRPKKIRTVLQFCPNCGAKLPV